MLPLTSRLGNKIIALHAKEEHMLKKPKKIKKKMKKKKKKEKTKKMNKKQKTKKKMNKKKKQKTKKNKKNNAGANDMLTRGGKVRNM
ncbi:hypothetical protein M8J76_002298 [Diaphorina citri]|nr:hypothetical protein M8J76_002298 [Diaphorina citri]